MTDKKPAPKPAKPPKPKMEFKIPKLTETQWGMVMCGGFFVVYFIYNFLMAPGVAPQPTMGTGAGSMVAPTEETAEQKFKRENRNAALPDGSGVPKDMVEKHVKNTQQVPFGDTELEFQVKLPDNWVMSEFARYGLPGEETYSVLTNIARYFGPAIEDARPFFWVEAERIKRYMTAETWARAYMIKRGITPEAMNIKSEKEVQALYVDTRDYRSYAIRTLFIVNGDTMVLASFGVPIQSYRDFKDIMGLSINSFRLLRPIQRHIEEIKEYKLLNVIKFNHFASWFPKNEFSESTLRPAVELHNPQEYNNPTGDLLQGLILVNAWRISKNQTPEAEFQEVKDRLQELRMTIKEPLEKSEVFAVRDNFIKIERTPYLALVNTYVRKSEFDIIKDDLSKTQQEVWITVLDNDYYRVYLTLITPLKSTNYVVWARNMAAYDLLTNSITLRGRPTE